MKLVYNGPLKVKQVQNVVAYQGQPVEVEDRFAEMLVSKYGFEIVGAEVIEEPVPEPEAVEDPEPADEEPTHYSPKRKRGRK